MIKRGVQVSLALVVLLAVLLAVVLVANTLRQGSRQLQVQPLAKLAADGDAVAQSLAVAVRARTISGLLDPAGTAAAFDTLHAHLLARYPQVHSKLQRVVVGNHGLLFTWPGSDVQLPALALLAHQDSVPIATGTEPLSKKPPFAGVIEDGKLWGRGALDNKSNLITQLEAVEMLLQSGFQPRRTVISVFGHDGEVGGLQGARQIVALLQQRGVKLGSVLDEGLAVTEGVLPGVKAALALIALAEKGIVSLKLVASAPPGHSSMPPAAGNSAIGMLSAALVRLEQQPMPGGISGAAVEMFAAVAPELPFGQRLAVSNLWLFRPLFERMLGSGGGATNAMLRTTTALTIVNAGNKENVPPGSAEAVVNFRILPGDTSAGVAAHVKRVIADERIAIVPLGAMAEPSKLSASQSDAFRLVERTVREVFPDALVAPGMMLAASDARHFDAIAEQSLRFMPIRFKPEDPARVHGTDERIAVTQLVHMVRFYHRLLSQAAG
ncbi:MAG: M20 family peptidase [Rubrivivax sp.]|nr:M20 family peptidase [Rubrivivax sp.]